MHSSLTGGNFSDVKEWSLRAGPKIFHVISGWMNAVLKKPPDAALIGEDLADVGADIASVTINIYFWNS